MNNQLIDQIDAVIAAKRQELKNLLFARDALVHIAESGGDADAATMPEILKLAPQLAVPQGLPPRKLRAGDKKARKNRIATAAKQRKPKTNRAGTKGTRRKYSAEFKLRALADWDAADTKKEVLEKHGIYPSHIATWQRQKDAGKLVPSGGESGESSLGLPSSDEDDIDPIDALSNDDDEIEEDDTSTPPTSDDEDGNDSSGDVLAEMHSGEDDSPPFAGAPTKEELEEFLPS